MTKLDLQKYQSQRHQRRRQLESQNRGAVKQSLRKEEYDFIIDAISDPLFAIDTQYRIVLTNKAATTLTGFNQEDLLGKRVESILRLGIYGAGSIYAREMDPFQKVLESGQNFEAISLNSNYYTINRLGETIPIAMNISATRSGWSVVGAIVVIQDLRVFKEIETRKAEVDFVYIASHQLRTPLTAVHWHVKRLKELELGSLNPNQKEYLQRVYDENEKMISLVEELLRVSRLQKGKIRLEPVNFDLYQTINEIVKLYAEEELKKKNLTLKYNSSSGLIVFHDKTLIDQVIKNIYYNAIIYNQQNGEVEIKLQKLKAGDHRIKEHLPYINENNAATDYVLIDIINTGIGIKEQDIKFIGTKYYRGSSVKEKFEGNGLGVYLAAEVTKISGGAMWFESVPNQKTSFHLLLPEKLNIVTP